MRRLVLQKRPPAVPVNHNSTRRSAPAWPRGKSAAPTGLRVTAWRPSARATCPWSGRAARTRHESRAGPPAPATSEARRQKTDNDGRHHAYRVHVSGSVEGGRCNAQEETGALTTPTGRARIHTPSLVPQAGQGGCVCRPHPARVCNGQPEQGRNASRPETSPGFVLCELGNTGACHAVGARRGSAHHTALWSARLHATLERRGRSASHRLARAVRAAATRCCVRSAAHTACAAALAHTAGARAAAEQDAIRLSTCVSRGAGLGGERAALDHGAQHERQCDPDE
mmetsp:Transcript_25187/g.73906  ORF Transcript_25187/g.73906 Transcript_25187/m.73906 type:complete len:284 (-) Transcript_25187:103-954(-)